MFLKLSAAIILLSHAEYHVVAFSGFRVQSNRPRTFLNLEDHVADMIDKEMVRLRTLKEEAERRTQRNQAVITPELPTGYDFQFEDGMMVNDEDTIEKMRDMRLAERNPEKYCQDRCVKSGYCDVYEDMYDFSPEEVLKFCTDCVLSDAEDPCDIPESFYPEGIDDDDVDEYDGNQLRP
eukprot:CAMPEP_0172512106 /NCGR_PEP_ID=MMETSP1066-20121228/241745_1 /TAXON_ID=671091 /ORGANISM="Coscinodiscus wailesii, Strain CCMP2513" /LENGTH=178 /DNA_ID=CAMNT_0013291759 /DNA_START=106 /DNA_END=642 /DNA_ORIENTATION=+